MKYVEIDKSNNQKQVTGIYSAPALSKGLRILEHLSSSEKPLTTHEIASALGHTRNEIFRFIAVLEMEGYVAKSKAGGGYVVTSRLLELGLALPRVNDIFDIISPLAENLTYSGGAPCHLALVSGSEIIVMRRWEPINRLSVNVPVGSRRDMEASGSGLGILCSMSQSELNAMVVEIKARNPLFKTDQLLPYREELISVGYLKFESGLMEGIIDISIPLISKTGQLIGALTVPYSNNITCESSIEKIGDMLLSIAKDVSRKLVKT